MRAANRWRRNCSSSTNSATRMKSVMDRCRRDWRTRPGWRSPIVRNSRSRSPSRSRSRRNEPGPPGPIPAATSDPSEPPRGNDPMSDSTNVMPEHPPVTDWAHDFDHTDPSWTQNPFPIWDQLRAHSPVVHTERFNGCYMPTTYQAVKEIAYDTESFSSRRVIVRDERPEVTRNAAPPITSDPPDHKPAKQLLLPPFTPDAMKKLEPRVRAICNELIDEFIADGRCDAAARYTKYIPVRTIAHMLGIPEQDGDLFIQWIHMILELSITNEAMLLQAVQEMTAYFTGHIEARKVKPTDDLISTLMNAKDEDGQPLDDGHVMGSLRLILIAGIDTTWSAIG